MANEYQMRLKDMHAAEKIKEVSDKLSHEIEALKNQLEALKVEKVKWRGRLCVYILWNLSYLGYRRCSLLM